MVRRGRRMLPGTAAGRRAIVGLALAMLAVLLLIPVERGISVERRSIGPDGGLPVRVYVPDAAGTADAPGIVVAHGFAGSAALMHTWSLALAHAGFVVVAPDLPGHGANLAPLADRGDVLRDSVTVALEHLASVPQVEADRIGLLGHSMGSGAVLSNGIARTDAVRAVVAVSPTDAPVTPDEPRDLLLLAGANESRFVANAESLLERAGGARGEPGDGDARALVIIPLVEHVSILFAPAAHAASVEWLASALDHPPVGPAPMGPLLGWLVLVLAILTLWKALVAQAATPAAPPVARSARWVALPLGGIAATASLVIIERSIDLAQLTGVLLVGEVGLWFLMTGAVWLRFGIRPAPPEARDLGWALLAVAMLVGLGASTTLAWAPWWLAGTRTTIAALLALLLLPYSIAAAAVLHGRSGRSAVIAWSLTAAAVVITLGAAVVVIPTLSFLILVIPLLPLVLAATTAVAVGVDRPWATGTASAVLLGWLLAMLFPLA